MNLLIQDSIPAEVPEWCDLFHHPLFYQLNKGNHSVYFSFLLEGKLIGVIHFTEIEPGVFKSPHRGTFGSINFKPEVEIQTQHLAVKMATEKIQELGAKRIEVVSAPFAHDLAQMSVLFNAYIQEGYTISNHEINHCLLVDQTPLIEKMMRNNKKRLNKCVREGFQFKQVKEHSEIEMVYSTIKQNRESKGYKVSMTLEQILKMKELFPENLFFFNTSTNGESAASAICMRINACVLYVFYWGDRPGYEQYSPVAHLADGIYAYAQAGNYTLIDAGTSSLEGVPNYGVSNFKENLGFTISSKPTYAKQL
jgi:hypothetical protein